MENLVRRYRKLIMESDNKQELLDSLFREYKTRVFDYFNGTIINPDWRNYIVDLVSIIRDMPIEYIIDTNIASVKKPTLDSKAEFLRCKVFKKYEIEDVLDYIVYYGRKKLVPNQDIRKYDDYDVVNRCSSSSKNVDDIADVFELGHRIVRIDPGFSYEDLLLNGSGKHYFNIIEYKGKEFLVDVSYKQFFKKHACSLERLGVPLLFPPLAGIFMIQDDFRKQVAECLLKRGWIELTPETGKAYFDGFAISYRNGLYYEDKDIVFETDYTYANYKNFLKGIDNQVKHEGKNVLGYQLRPLKNPSMRFK